MNSFRAALIGILCLTGIVTQSSGQESMQVNEEVVLSDVQLRALEVALSELKKKRLNSLGYRAAIFKDGSYYIVIFEDPLASASHFGSSGKKPRFEVEMNAKFEVTKHISPDEISIRNSLAGILM